MTDPKNNYMQREAQTRHGGFHHDEEIRKLVQMLLATILMSHLVPLLEFNLPLCLVSGGGGGTGFFDTSQAGA